MLDEDAPDLRNHGGIIHANVEAVYEQLRDDAVQDASLNRERSRRCRRACGGSRKSAMTECERIDESMPSSQSLRRSGCPEASSPALVARWPRNP